MNYVRKEINRSYDNNKWKGNNKFEKKSEFEPRENFEKKKFQNFNNNKNRSEKTYNNNFNKISNSNNYNNNYKNNSNGHKTYRPLDQIECRNCKQKSHIMRNCPKFKQVNNINDATTCNVNVLNAL